MSTTAATKRATKSSTPALDKPGEVAAAHIEALSVGKQGYKTADLALEVLIGQCTSDNCPTCGSRRFKNDGIVKAADGRRFRIVDKYASRIAVNVGMNARRYELEEVTQPCS